MRLFILLLWSSIAFATVTPWGSIGGVITNQTDLQTEFATKYNASNPAGYITNAVTTLPSLQLPYSQVTGAPAALSFTSPLSLTGSTVSIPAATSSVNGYLTSANFTTFNNKQSALTFSDSLVNSYGTVTLVNDSATPGNTKYYGTNGSGSLGFYSIPATGVTSVSGSSPIVSSGGATPTISCNVASGSQAGCLASADWTTFNGKQASGNYITALTGDATASGPGSATLTLATVATAGTSPKVTYNAKGLVTSGTTLSSGDIPNNAANTTGTASNITATSNSTLTSLPSLTKLGTLTTDGIVYTSGGTGTLNAGWTLAPDVQSSGNGTSVSLNGGATSASSDVGGNLTLSAGAASGTGGYGGTTYITGGLGNPSGPNGGGGSVYIDAGGSASPGGIFLGQNNANEVAIQAPLYVEKTANFSDNNIGGGGTQIAVTNNSNPSGSVTGLSINVDGAATTNIAAIFQAYGSTSGNNYGLLVPSGRVGIGTSTPLEELSVAGTLNILSDGTASSDNSSFNFKVSADVNNSFTDALYIYPRDSAYHRIFLGTSSDPLYALNLGYVVNIEGMPAQVALQSSPYTTLGDGSQYVSQLTGGDGAGLILTGGSFTNFLLSPLNSDGMRSVPWLAYAADTDGYLQNAGYVYAMNSTPSQWSRPHTAWYVNGTSNKIADLSMNGGLGLYLQSSTQIGLSINGAASQSANYLNVTSSGGSAGNIFNISSAGNVGIGTTMPDSLLHVNGHIHPGGSAPTVTSCGSGTIVTGSSDNKGSISGITAATACTLTFAKALAAAPACVFSTSVTGISTYISSISTSAVTVGMTALTGTLYYICF